MPPALQLIDWDFVSDEGLHWEVRGTVLLFPGREEGLMRALVLVDFQTLVIPSRGSVDCDPVTRSHLAHGNAGGDGEQC